MDLIAALFEDTYLWLLVALAVVVGFAFWQWNKTIIGSLRHKLSESSAQVAMLQKTSETLGQAIRNIEEKLQLQIDCITSKVATVSGDVGEVIRILGARTRDADRRTDQLGP